MAADARFVASIEMGDGVPKVTWSPDLGAERVYRVLGARGLEDATARISTDRRSLREAKWLQWCEPGTSVGAECAWVPVTEETKGAYKFFKVSVEMP